MADPLKLILKRPSHDPFSSYALDLMPLVRQHAPWFADHHREGEGFPAKVVAALEQHELAVQKQVKEHAEAEAATANQGDVVKEGAELVREVRRRGAYVAREILHADPSPAGAAEARRVQLACAIGDKINLNRQTGVRRALVLQNAGLTGITEVMILWKQPADLKSRVKQGLDSMDEALAQQAAEQLEASLAQDQLDEQTLETVEICNRLLRLANLEWKTAPDTLRNGLQTLQNHHTEIFSSTPEPGETAQEDEDEEEEEEEEESDPSKSQDK